LEAIPRAPIELVIIEITFEFVDINQILESDFSLLKYVIVDLRQFNLRDYEHQPLLLRTEKCLF
jgi:hypothetical protein